MSKPYFMEDYRDEHHVVNPCPDCGKAPDRNNCGPEFQAVSCYDCNVHADGKGNGSQAKLLDAIQRWNAGDHVRPKKEIVDLDEIWSMVRAERSRQDEKWGTPQHNSPAAWISILVEEVGELAEAVNEKYVDPNGNGFVKDIIREAIQVAAVAVSIAQHVGGGLWEN